MRELSEIDMILFYRGTDLASNSPSVPASLAHDKRRQDSRGHKNNGESEQNLEGVHS